MSHEGGVENPRPILHGTSTAMDQDMISDGRPSAAGLRATTIERAYWPAVVMIFVGGLVLRALTFTEYWTGIHNAWGGAFYGNVARNFVKYGFRLTDFAPVVNTGVVDPTQFDVYFHHPVLSMWLTGASFFAFGVHEWSARLAPLLFSLLTMALVFEFSRATFGRATALFALLFFAVLPVDAYYATHLDPYGSMAIFFTALVVEAYRRWLDSGQTRYYAICAVAILLGCMTSWFTYFVVPLIVAHGWLVRRPALRRETLIRLFLLPAFAFVAFGVFLLHRSIALSDGRPELFGALVDRFLIRTVQLPLDRSAIAIQHLRHIWWLYTLPFVAMTAAWVVLFARDLWRKRLQTADWCIAILLAYGVLYALAFPGHLPAHDYFVRAYAPGVALACAVVLARALRRLNHPGSRRVVAGAVIVVTCWFAIATTRTLHAADNRNFGLTLRGFSEAVAGLTTPRDPIFTPIRDDRVMAYYVDRPMTFNLDTPEKLEAAVAGARGPYLIILPERNADRFPEMLSYLQERYSTRRDRGLFIFEGAAVPGVR
jgi:4-amino-4-deoxy-L-arabinose transferase-like glycosyltransferase